MTSASALPPPPRVAVLAGRSWLLPAAISVALALWQFSFNSVSPEPRRAWAMTASMGLCADAPYFFYFFHHLGQFPVGALEVPTLGPGRQDALDFVAHHGDRLKMDFGWPTNTPRFGDYGKLFLYYPDLLLRGDPAHPSTIPADEILFIGALLAVFWAFWHEGHPLLGTLVAVLVGSDPFQIVETYGRGNIFSIPISVALLLLAAHLRLLSGRRGLDRWAWGIAIASGAALATVREIRTEAGIMGAAVLATCLLARAPWPRRLAVAAVFLLAFGASGAGWSRYWAAKFANAERFVARAGGEVFRTPLGTHHAFWHAIYCGLGDYGADRGFTWDDRDAFRWATTRDPATNPNPIPYHYRDGYYLEETYDGVHAIAPTDLPGYNRLVRTRVLNTIREHPAWYGRVLLDRVAAIQRDATPAAVSFGSVTLGIPGTGWLIAPVLLLALWRRQRLHAALILFTLPLSAVALLVYSGRGMTHYGIAHLVAVAVALEWLVHTLAQRAHGRNSGVR